MGTMMIVNGSPRAPRSNSKQYGEIFAHFWGEDVDEYSVTTRKHQEACREIENHDHLLLVFPLYVDSLPVTLMELMKEMENYPFQKRPAIHVLINCGFLEPEQNLVALDIVRLFCKEQGFPFGMALCIGSGEAILSTPFSFFVKWKIRRLARGIHLGKSEVLKVTMPISKKMFLSASTSYWLRRGEKNGIDLNQMSTMEIESNTTLE